MGELWASWEAPKSTNWGAKDVWGLLKLNSGRSQISATQHLSFSASQLLSISASQHLSSSLLREPGRSFLGPQSALYRKKVSSGFFCQGLHVLPCPNNFSPACFGCKNEVVDGFMCLEIFEKSIWTASGEPLARSFDKKMVFLPKPYYFIFDH
mgnify:CR=1 FL=1